MARNRFKIIERGVEKCILCDGRGYLQAWSDELNKWVTQPREYSRLCKACKGKGKRSYYVYDNGGICFQKEYE